MSKVVFSNKAQVSFVQSLNTIVLNQRGRAFTEQDICSIVNDEDGIHREEINRVISRLNKLGLIYRVGNKYYTKTVARRKAAVAKRRASAFNG